MSINNTPHPAPQSIGFHEPNPISPMARLWFYDFLSKWLLETQSHTTLDSQLCLEIFFDEMVLATTNNKFPSIYIDYDFEMLFLFCQQKARNGFYLDDMLLNIIPDNELRVLRGAKEDRDIASALLKCKVIVKNNLLNPPKDSFWVKIRSVPGKVFKLTAKK